MAIRPLKGEPGVFISTTTGKKFKIVEWREDDKYDTIELQTGTTLKHQSLASDNSLGTVQTILTDLQEATSTLNGLNTGKPAAYYASGLNIGLPVAQATDKMVVVIGQSAVDPTWSVEEVSNSLPPNVGPNNFNPGLAALTTFGTTKKFYLFWVSPNHPNAKNIYYSSRTGVNSWSTPVAFIAAAANVFYYIAAEELSDGIGLHYQGGAVAIGFMYDKLTLDPCGGGSSAKARLVY